MKVGQHKVQSDMDLLGWKEITTSIQKKNGTRIFQLPIKKYGQFIEVGSFESGYVRRMNGGYTPYQLNKCGKCTTYHKDYDGKWINGEWVQKWTGKYRKYVGKSRILIDNEYDRINYLITFCLKNYYINQANMIEEGKFVPKWKHEYEMKNGSLDKVRELQTENRKLHLQINRLKEERDTIYLNQSNESLDELHVTVNGHKYKVI